MKESVPFRVSTGIPVSISIRKFTRIFFHFHYGKGPRRSEILFRCPDLSGTEFWNLFRKISGTTFRKISGTTFPKPEIFPGNISKTVSFKSSSPMHFSVTLNYLCHSRTHIIYNSRQHFIESFNFQYYIYLSIFTHKNNGSRIKL